MSRPITPAALAFAALVFAACSADAKDFQEQGEKFIEGDEVRETMGGVRMSDAECEEPADTEKDTVYACRASGSDDNIWTFRIEITGSTSLRIIAGEVATSAIAPTDTTSETTATTPVSTTSTDAPVTDAPPQTTTAAASTTVAPTTTTA